MFFLSTCKALICTPLPLKSAMLIDISCLSIKLVLVNKSERLLMRKLLNTYIDHKFLPCNDTKMTARSMTLWPWPYQHLMTVKDLFLSYDYWNMLLRIQVYIFYWQLLQFYWIFGQIAKLFRSMDWCCLSVHLRSTFWLTQNNLC